MSPHPFSFSDPAEILSSVRWPAHIAHLYDGAEERVPAMLSYFEAGLRRGERCFYAADPLTVGATQEGLRKLGFAVEELVARGTLVFPDPAGTYLPAGVFSTERLFAHWRELLAETAALGYAGVRFAGDMSWALGCPPGCDEVPVCEVRLSPFLAQHPARLVCQYDRQLHSPEAIRTVLRTHPLVIHGKLVARNFYYVPVAEVATPAAAAVEVERMLANLREWEEAQATMRRNEERFRRFFDLGLIGMAVTGPTSHFLEVNGKLCQMLGYTPEELHSRTWEGLTHPDDLGSDLALYRRAVAGEIDGYSIDKRFLRKDGSVIYTSISVHCLRHPDRSVEYFIGLLQDQTERTLARLNLEEATELLKGHAGRFFQEQEQERRHIARELHDEVGQTLTAAKLNLSLISPELSGLAHQRLEESLGILDRLMDRVRRLSLDLRPPLLDELGLVPALRWLVDAQTQRAGVRGRFHRPVEVAVLKALEPTVVTACFRIAQEAITNVLRHAGARHLDVALEVRPGWLWLAVRDDGHGFEVAERQHFASRGGSLGLLTMRERALLAGGGLEIISGPARGTELRAWFPLSAQPALSMAEDASHDFP